MARLPHDEHMDRPEILIAERLSAFPEVERVILFGSRARGDGGPRADIDIAVDCPKASTVRWFDMIDAADEAATLLMIDLVRLDEAPPELTASIREEGRILYERQERQTSV